LATQPIYIDLSDNLRRMLASNRVDLQTALKKEGIDSELQGLSLEGRPAARDPFLIILAAGVTASLVGGAISRIVAAVSAYKHAQMKERDLHVALNRNGDAIIDNGGNPVYNLAEKPSQLAPQDISTTKLIAGKLLTFDVTTGNAANKPTKATAKQEVAKKTTAKRPVKSVAKKRRG
jgi:hypothetical protein